MSCAVEKAEFRFVEKPIEDGPGPVALDFVSAVENTGTLTIAAKIQSVDFTITLLITLLNQYILQGLASAKGLWS
jgi:hypothetical protein